MVDLNLRDNIRLPKEPKLPMEAPSKSLRVVVWKHRLSQSPSLHECRDIFFLFRWVTFFYLSLGVEIA